MIEEPNNLTLIGMPGSGKSTVGRLLAERLGWAFLDVDLHMEHLAGRKLWQIVEAEGFEGLARLEQEANATLTRDRTVIAPGGSVIYFEPAMRNLRSLGPVIYLDVPAAILERRAGDLKQRATMIRPGMTLGELLVEREPLYRRWADLVMDCGEQAAEAVAQAVAERLLQGLRHGASRSHPASRRQSAGQAPLQGLPAEGTSASI